MIQANSYSITITMLCNKNNKLGHTSVNIHFYRLNRRIIFQTCERYQHSLNLTDKKIIHQLVNYNNIVLLTFVKRRKKLSNDTGIKCVL